MIIPANLKDALPLNFPLSYTIPDLWNKWGSRMFPWFRQCKDVIAIQICIPILCLSYLYSYFFCMTGQLHAYQINVWSNKCLRMKLQLLILPKSTGGIALPDLFKYPTAGHLVRLIDWCRHFSYIQWISLEQSNLST